jgi:hypothetical protein
LLIGAAVMLACAASACSGGHRTGHDVSRSEATRPNPPIPRPPAAAPAWTAATARRLVGKSTITVAGRPVAIDASALVCWRIRRPRARRGAVSGPRFKCIAPTFRGAAAGPDILVVVQPTSRTTFAVLDARFSRY